MASQDTTVAAKSPLKGSCLCRAIQYEVTGDPTRRALCHCEHCSKASGSSFMANWWFDKDSFTIVQDSGTLRAYKDNAETIRSFCGKCGSPLFITSTNIRDTIVVMSGTLDDAPDLSPNVEFFCRNKVKWLGEVEGAQTHEVVP